MKMNDYQELAGRSAMYPEEVGVAYATLGLVNEAGEVAGKYKKHLRGDYSGKQAALLMREELGDVLWYVAILAAELGMKLEDVGQANIEKLASRMERGVVKGDGDHR